MINNIKKYFVTLLSFLLVLSNFGFATHLMICQMSDYMEVCECDHEKNPAPKSTQITDENDGCCNENIIELSNKNDLAVVKVDLLKDIFIFAANVLISSESLITSLTKSILLENIGHVPRADIPIFNSSLLI